MKKMKKFLCVVPNPYNKELFPLLIRKPSVHASEPRTVWTTFLTTDKFMLIGLIPLDFTNARGGRIPIIMYEIETGETSMASFIDTEYAMEKWGPGTSTAIAKNMSAGLMQIPPLIEAYKKKRLKGNLEKLVATLDEEDNPIVQIIKFK